MEGIRKFKVNTGGLSQGEKVLFDKLIRAAESIAPLYLKQKNPKYPGANFYPHKVSREEIKKAAKQNPAILDPYTFVEQDKFGELVAVPFHIKFHRELTKISNLLKEAANLSPDRNLKLYLQSRAEALLTDNYDESNILWLKTANSQIGFVIGPFDRYLDKLFFKKRAYMAWVGILDKEQTREAEKLKSMVLTSQRKCLPGTKRVKTSLIRTRVEDTAIFSGLIADFLFVGNNLPSSADLYLVKKYGTLSTIFKPTLKSRFENGIFQIFKRIFSETIQKKYSKKNLYQGYLRSVILHEVCHSLMRYEDATTRLEEFFPYFDELYTEILGIKNCGSLVLKGALTQKELESILIMYISHNFNRWLSFLKNPNLIHYARGAAIVTNYLLQERAIKIDKRITLSKFANLYICIDHFSRLLEYHLALGSYEEAKKFIKQYSSFEVFEPFLPQLRKIIKKR